MRIKEEYRYGYTPVIGGGFQFLMQHFDPQLPYAAPQDIIINSVGFYTTLEMAFILTGHRPVLHELDITMVTHNIMYAVTQVSPDV